MFPIIDGDAARGVRPARPRHWLAGVAILIIAIWLHQALWNLGFSLGARAFDGAVGAFRGQALSVMAAEAFAYGAIGLIALEASRRLDGRGAGAFGLETGKLPSAALWALVGVCAAIPDLIQWPGNANFETAPAVLAAIAPVTLIQAGAEEIVFRGLILTTLAARYGAGWGLTISAALFALWHVRTFNGLGDLLFTLGDNFVFGLIVGVVVLKHGSLWGAIALHLVWNLVALVGAGIGVGDHVIGEGLHRDVWQAIFMAYTYDWAGVHWSEVLDATIIPIVIHVAALAAFARATVLALFSARSEPTD
ncbi:MAG: CPBP family intramembrane metalloprotease [Alphaproteobacteria bacterium]|nr:CPBP family intramembrane metalloprotease [Alphaproteobacteria bacterium]